MQLAVAERTVAGDDHLRLEREHPVARVDPPLHRAGPHDRVAAVEHQVAGEQHPRVGQVGDHVASGVGGAELEEAHRAITDQQVELAVEGGGRRGDLDAVEGEVAEDLLQVRPRRAHVSVPP